MVRHVSFSFVAAILLVGSAAIQISVPNFLMTHVDAQPTNVWESFESDEELAPRKDIKVLFIIHWYETQCLCPYIVPDNIFPESLIFVWGCALLCPAVLRSYPWQYTRNETGNWQNTTLMRRHDRNWRSSLTSLATPQRSQLGRLGFDWPVSLQHCQGFRMQHMSIWVLGGRRLSQSCFSREKMQSLICAAIFFSVLSSSSAKLS